MKTGRNIRVFQVDHDKDTERLAYENYEFVMKHGGINPALYRQIYGGMTACSSPEEIFSLCNQNPPPGYSGESMSVGNVLEICDGENKGFYFCDSVGFKPIDFNIAQTDHAEMLKILIVERNKKPYTAEIRNELDAYRSVVGGYLEAVHFDPLRKAVIFCDEEGVLKGKLPNRLVGECLICDTFMIIGSAENEIGESVEVSLTNEQISEFTEQFSAPVIRLKYDYDEEYPNYGLSQV